MSLESNSAFRNSISSYIPKGVSFNELEELERQEKKHPLPTFDFEVAFALGCFVRENAIRLFPDKAIVIDISLPSGQCLFHTTTNHGTALDNDLWVQRKRNTVFRFGHSSLFMGRKMSSKKAKTMEEAFYISHENYAVHGGAIPLFVEAIDAVVACLTVSGLKQEEDHTLAMATLGGFLQKQSQDHLSLD
ncbi:LAMI_0D08482g1_1 [Lachancea mirantina]|uniref:LAMI_0D08482g1_1 n=1 Tax=Lachancea mirantina TaxID=1230905 RepID=A0A1G4JCZ7_9SACH|nr:LAMI_0D08482g1_1 [Lachancea mirantina]